MLDSTLLLRDGALFVTVVPLPSTDVIELRRYREGDAGATLAIFWEAVREGTADHYTEAERIAWASAVFDVAAWAAARASRATWVGDVCGRAVGSADLKDNGEVGMLYVHPDHTGCGVGKALLDEVERSARDLDMPFLHAQVSLTAQPLFRRQGFILVREKVVELGGERLANAVMEKPLEPIV